MKKTVTLVRLQSIFDELDAKTSFSILESVCLASLWEKNILSNEFNLPKYKVNDEDDRKYLNLALSVNANYLITGNVKDFPLKNYDSLSVLSPNEFLKSPDINK